MKDLIKLDFFLKTLDINSDLELISLSITNCESVKDIDWCIEGLKKIIEELEKMKTGDFFTIN